jgi:hypothetical protein
MAARIDDILILDAALSKTGLAKYLRDREAVLPSDFGGLCDGVANNTAAIQACFDRASAGGGTAVRAHFRPGQQHPRKRRGRGAGLAHHMLWNGPAKAWSACPGRRRSVSSSVAEWA